MLGNDLVSLEFYSSSRFETWAVTLKAPLAEDQSRALVVNLLGDKKIKINLFDIHNSVQNATTFNVSFHISIAPSIVSLTYLFNCGLRRLEFSTLVD
jgi:hypothetical protein